MMKLVQLLLSIRDFRLGNYIEITKFQIKLIHTFL